MRNDVTSPALPSGYNDRGDESEPVQRRNPAMRTILGIILLCSALGCGRTQADASAETMARGKALVDAADCGSCHTADPAKPLAGGKRIDTPFGGIFAPNLTPDQPAR